MVANKYILGLALCIVYTVLACKDKPQKPTRIKRLPTVDSTDTFLFYKLPPADFKLTKDSTHIGYWSMTYVYRNEVGVKHFYTKNYKLYMGYQTISVYFDSITTFYTAALINDNEYAYNLDSIGKSRNSFLKNDTLIERTSNIDDVKYRNIFYRIPRLTFPRERALHYFNQCRRHDTTTLFRWVYGNMPAYSRFFQKDDSLILEAYGRSGKLSRHPMVKKTLENGCVRIDHHQKSWQGALEYFYYDPTNHKLFIKNDLHPEQSEPAKIIYNKDYEYDFSAGDSLFFYGNPDIEEW